MQADSLLSEPPGKDKVTQPGSCHTAVHRMTSSRMGGTGNIESQERPQSRKLRFGPSFPEAVTAKCSDVVGSDEGPGASGGWGAVSPSNVSPSVTHTFKH